MTILSNQQTAPKGAAFASAQFLRDLVGYGLVSVGALVVDWGAMSLLYRFFGVHYLAATTLGFLLGLCFAYGMSVRFVFGDRRKLSAGAEFFGFLATGIIGLLLSNAIVYLCVAYFQAPADIAKAPAVAVVFVFNFLSRRIFLFARD
jgi:putative flippase GtrA